MPDQPLPEQVVHLEGPPGETLISHPVAFVMSSPEVTSLQAQFDEILRHVVELHDDRLLALTGALILESVLDRLLSAVMPRYKVLQDERDFSFSMRIQLARALDLIPRRFLSCADTIRQIRNDFAHNLGLVTFAQLPVGRVPATRERVREFGDHYVTDNPTDAQLVMRLIQFAAMGFIVYGFHMGLFGQAVRAPGFAAYMEAFAKEKRTHA